MERSYTFADRFDAAVSAPMRSALSRFIGIFPFSVTELILLFLPVGVLILLWLGIRAARGQRSTTRYLAALFSAAVLFFCGFVFLFSPGYRRTPIEVTLGLSCEEPTEGELAACVAWLTALSTESAIPPSEDELNARLRDAFAGAGEHYGLAVNTSVLPKRTATPLFLRCGLFGLFAFPLGEVTVTEECPEAIRAFTAAHEIAHASGYAREEEADLVAFLSCLESGDAYLRYAGATGMLSRVLTSLSAAAPGIWEDASRGIPDEVRTEFGKADLAAEEAIRPTAGEASPPYDGTVRLLVALYRARTDRY